MCSNPGNFGQLIGSLRDFQEAPLGKSPVRFGGFGDFGGLGVYRNGAPVHAIVGIDLEREYDARWDGRK